MTFLEKLKRLRPGFRPETPNPFGPTLRQAQERASVGAAEAPRQGRGERVSGRLRPGSTATAGMGGEPSRGPGVAHWGALIVVVMAAWAVRPLPAPEAEVEATSGRTVEAEAPVILASAAPLGSDTSALLERNPLGIEIARKPPPPPAPVPPAPPPPPPPPVKPAPPGPVEAVGLKLQGTIVGQDVKSAIIQRPGGRAEVYAIGDKVAGRTVVSVTRKRVVLRNGGGLEYLDIKEGEDRGNQVQQPTRVASYKPVVTQPPPAPRYQPPPSGAPARVIPKDVARQEVIRKFGNPANFLSQVSAEPFYENARFAGYYVQAVRNDSFASRMGLMTGDVLETVNGSLIDTAQKAFRLLGVIHRAPKMEVVVRRGGQRVKLDFNLL